MSINQSTYGSFSQGVGDIGAAGAAALRKVGGLAQQAPKGRFFASIASLNELSAQTLEALEQGDMQRASHVAAKLSEKSGFKIPSFFKKKA